MKNRKKFFPNRFLPVRISENYVEFSKYWYPSLEKRNHKERMKKLIKEYFFPVIFFSSFFDLILFLAITIVTNTNETIMFQSVLIFFPIFVLILFSVVYIINYRYLDQPMRFILDSENKIMLVSDQRNHRRLVAYSLRNIEFISVRVRELGNSQVTYFPSIPKRKKWVNNPDICCSIELQLICKKKKGVVYIQQFYQKYHQSCGI